jgi:hypothetical protein
VHINYYAVRKVVPNVAPVEVASLDFDEVGLEAESGQGGVGVVEKGLPRGRVER